MALADVQPVTTPGKRGGGGLWGLIGGAVGLGLGAAAAPFTAGASLAPAIAMGALGGAGAGLGIGSAVGEMVDPSKGGEITQTVPKSETSRKKLNTVAMQSPDVQLAQMQNSKSLLKQSATPDAEKYMSIIDEASARLKNRMGVA